MYSNSTLIPMFQYFHSNQWFISYNWKPVTISLEILHGK